MKSLRDQLREATQVPPVHFFAQLAAQMAMTGVKVVPERYWDRITDWLMELDGEELNRLNLSQFTLHENHRRSGDHDMWQEEVFRKLARENETVWVIPIDELVCLKYDDEQACDFVSIERLSFCGTESELDEAIEELIS
jgi:hypothetical protein